MRAISTVLDVALFVLLVSAAVGTLTLAGPPTKADSSVDETADVLATSTLSVEYELRGQTRHAHGTVGCRDAGTASSTEPNPDCDALVALPGCIASGHSDDWATATRRRRRTQRDADSFGPSTG